jgi:hypothetical protein
MKLPHVPNEIILALASFLDCEKDISSLSQVNNRLQALLQY